MVDWPWRKKKERGVKSEKGVSYRLVWMPRGKKGWKEVEAFAFPVKPDECEELMLKAGSYQLQKRVMGNIAGYEWTEPYTVEKDVEGASSDVVEVDTGKPKLTDSDKIMQLIEDDLLRGLRWVKLPELIAQAYAKVGGVNLTGSGGKGDGEPVKQKSIGELLAEGKAEYDKLASFFAPKGSTTTKEMEIKVEGTIPAWLAWGPEFVDRAMDKVEKRLDKWGLIGGEEKEVEKGPLLKLPDKPSVEEQKPALSLPEKPSEETKPSEEAKPEEEKEGGDEETE